MQFDELRFVCQEAARDLADQHPRPIPPAIVLPGPSRTRIVRLPEFPEDDEGRHAFIATFADDEVRRNLVPCWGFLAEAEVDGVDHLLVAWGARQHAPHLSAAPFGDDGLGEFVPDEELDPTALPFLHPLQHIVDSMSGVQAPDDVLGTSNGNTLPLID